MARKTNRLTRWQCPRCGQTIASRLTIKDAWCDHGPNNGHRPTRMEPTDDATS